MKEDYINDLTYYYKLESFVIGSEQNTLVTVLITRTKDFKWEVKIMKNSKLIFHQLTNESVLKLKKVLQEQYGMSHCKWQRLLKRSGE